MSNEQDLGALDVLDRAGAGSLTPLLDSLPDSDQLTFLHDSGGRIDHAALARLRSGPGRKVGTPNKRSGLIAKLIVEQYGDPLLSQAKAAFMPLDVLTKVLRAADGDDNLERKFERMERLVARLAPRLSRDTAEKLANRLLKFMTKPTISAFDVWKEQNAIKKELAPYVYGKQPIAVEIGGRADVILNIPGLTDQDHLATIIAEQDISDEDIARISFIPEGDSDA